MSTPFETLYLLSRQKCIIIRTFGKNGKFVIKYGFFAFFVSELKSISTSHQRTLILIRCQRPFICPQTPGNKGFPAIRLFQMEVPVAGFFCLTPVAARVFLHDFLWLPCKVTRFWPGNVYLYTILLPPV